MKYLFDEKMNYVSIKIENHQKLKTDYQIFIRNKTNQINFCWRKIVNKIETKLEQINETSKSSL